MSDNTTLDYIPKSMPQNPDGYYRYLLDELSRVSQALKAANEQLKQLSTRV